MKRLVQIGAVLVVGMVMGAWAARHGHFPSPSTQHPPARESSPTAAGELRLADFESPEEIAKHWKPRGVVATPSEDHATHGRFSAKVTYDTSEAPSFAMEDYLDSDRRRRDWRGYALLSFDVYNAQSGQERVILQLKDKDGRAYKEDIFISGKSSQHVSVRLEDQREMLDLAHVTQFNLFRWNPRKAGAFYVDDVVLQPAREPAAGSQKTQVPATPAVKPAERWQIAWASSLEKLPRDPAKLHGVKSGAMQLAMAGGEYESAQLVLIGGISPVHVTVAVGPIANADGTVRFPADVVEIRKVGYVKTQPPYYPVSYVGEWPDPLPPAHDVDVPAGAVQPVWLTIGAPPSLPAGRYAGTITLTDDAGRTEQVPLEIRVWRFVLPQTSHLKTAFDFYQGRLEQAYREFVEGGSAWSGRMEEMARLYFLDMIKHRVMPILSADPMSRTFARDIDFYLRVGLNAIGVGSRGGSNGNNWPKDQRELEQLMSWYRQAALSLKSQALLDRAYVYTYDEPTPGDPQAALVMENIHWADPGLRNLLVMHDAPDPVRHAEWLKHADILCIHIASYDVEHAKQFAQQGKEMWMYVSSPSHPFPALVIDYPAIAYRILPWMCWKVDAKGLLYWCVNFWKRDPWENAANYSEDQNGNGSLYYPSVLGPVPSIRMEVLRDGMEDYEYLYYLRELIEAAKAKGGVDPALLEQAEHLAAVDPGLVDSLRSYSKDPEVLLANRQAIGELIERLQSLEQGS